VEAAVRAESRREAFRPSDRVKRRADFRRVQSGGRKIHTPHFVLAVLPRDDGGGTNRLGITVTRKIAPAVGRNRIKRVMREVFRKNRDLFPAGCDVVAIAKSGAHQLGYAEVLAEIDAAKAALARPARPRPRTT
jgi:ribonuclease P protein component